MLPFDGMSFLPHAQQRKQLTRDNSQSAAPTRLSPVLCDLLLQFSYFRGQLPLFCPQSVKALNDFFGIALGTFVSHRGKSNQRRRLGLIEMKNL